MIELITRQSYAVRERTRWKLLTLIRGRYSNVLKIHSLLIIIKSSLHPAGA